VPALGEARGEREHHPLDPAAVQVGEVERNATVRGYSDRTTQAEYVIRRSNGYDLGFRQQGDSYELVADFWGAKIDQQAFLNPITQKYAHKTLMATVQDQGFTVEEQEVLEDGTVRVVVGRWA